MDLAMGSLVACLVALVNRSTSRMSDSSYLLTCLEIPHFEYSNIHSCKPCALQAQPSDLPPNATRMESEDVPMQRLAVQGLPSFVDRARYPGDRCQADRRKVFVGYMVCEQEARVSAETPQE